MEPVVLVARKLRKSFPTGFTLAVGELTLGRGGVYSFVGPNGAGKTVLFEALSLLAPPDTGVIELDGESIFPGNGGARRTRQKMAMVMQRPYLFRGTVAENAGYGLRARRMNRREVARRVATTLERLGLAALARTDVNHLSGGQAQRVALARALVLEPEVLLLDEPTAHVDAQHGGAVERLLDELRREGCMTVLLSTHDLEQAYRLSDEVFLLVDGTLKRHAPQNCFLGTVTQADGQYWFAASSGLRLRVLAQRAGRARVFIDPRGILLSREPLRSSGRNSLPATVRSLEGEGRAMLVRVSADGAELTARVTRESVSKLALVPGESVHLTFKATGARVYPLS
jgi:molybdopterin-binding protein